MKENFRISEKIQMCCRSFYFFFKTTNQPYIIVTLTFISIFITKLAEAACINSREQFKIITEQNEAAYILLKYILQEILSSFFQEFKQFVLCKYISKQICKMNVYIVRKLIKTAKIKQENENYAKLQNDITIGCEGFGMIINIVLLNLLPVIIGYALNLPKIYSSNEFIVTVFFMLTIFTCLLLDCYFSYKICIYKFMMTELQAKGNQQIYEMLYNLEIIQYHCMEDNELSSFQDYLKTYEKSLTLYRRYLCCVNFTTRTIFSLGKGLCIFFGLQNPSGLSRDKKISLLNSFFLMETNTTRLGNFLLNLNEKLTCSMLVKEYSFIKESDGVKKGILMPNSHSKDISRDLECTSIEEYSHKSKIKNKYKNDVAINLTHQKSNLVFPCDTITNNKKYSAHAEENMMYIDISPYSFNSKINKALNCVDTKKKAKKLKLRSKIPGCEYNQSKDISRLFQTKNANKDKNESDISFDSFHIDSIEFSNVEIIGNKGLQGRKFNLMIEGNKKVAIWGSNGSGKTTIFRALLKLVDFQGEIYINNTSIRNLNTKFLRSNIGYIPQNLQIFNKNVRENIFYANKEENQTSLSKILEQSLMKTVNNKNNEKIAVKMSGGEKRKIMISRIEKKQYPLYLLDEPCANLDQKTSELVLRYYLSLESIVIMIVHDFNILEKFDQIIYL